MSISPENADRMTGAEPPSSEAAAPVSVPVRPWWRLAWWQWAFAGVAVVTVAAVSVVASGGAAGPDTYEVSGFMSLKDSGSTYSSSSIDTLERVVAGTDGMFECRGSRGYRDIAEGAEVKVYDEAGKIIAVGALGKGRTGQRSAAVCVFPIAVSKVPVGHRFYQVEVTRRGKVTVEEKAEAGKLFALLSLGD
ncbi:hypothetical protein N8J89_08280 [Crossiella sp. CA-258035]|uniref:hypothetical protein n=1 Tax=Crossiella sp. CA-258035 TaxID=2981138 RepID=UPI0024BC5124|nr:hypothetical protein [Crossiella sp. CA-258035]WHT21050.1 hypothetical protein N8J89_08280 [Crossiella sp. CA-258035]